MKLKGLASLIFLLSFLHFNSAKSETKKSFFNILPAELKVRLFEFFSLKELRILEKVNKDFWALAQDQKGKHHLNLIVFKDSQKESSLEILRYHHEFKKLFLTF